MEPRRQLGLLWGAAAAGLVAVSPWAPAMAGRLPECLFRSWTGVPCLSCGATRAALALARLDVATALAFNPLAAAGWIALVAGGAVAGVAALAGYGVPEPRPRALGGLRWAALAALAGNWAYLVRFPP